MHSSSLHGGAASYTLLSHKRNRESLRKPGITHSSRQQQGQGVVEFDPVAVPNSLERKVGWPDRAAGVKLRNIVGGKLS